MSDLDVVVQLSILWYVLENWQQGGSARVANQTQWML